ncbi:2-phosphosulfolactate phosphatase, partial [bacterium]
IDVLRAFSTAAYALAAGAERIWLVSSVEEALALRGQTPGALAMGEVGGFKAAGFDLGNSPFALGRHDLRGRTLIHRSSAGTQGVVRADRARALFGASFVCAAATARAVLALNPRRVTLVVTGQRPDNTGDEDRACAEYLGTLLRSENPNPAPYLRRVRESQNAALFTDPANPDFPADDLELCTQLDRFAFALPVRRADGLLEMTREE